MPVSVNQPQANASVGASSISRKERLIRQVSIGLILTAVAALIGFSVYYYVKVFRNRETFPRVVNEVNEQSLIDSGYKKVNSNDEKGSIFVPNYWSQIDPALNVFGDVLNGSNAYINSYPNSVCQIDVATCRTFAEKSFNELKSVSTYSGATLMEAGTLKTINNKTGCFFKAESSVGQNTYEIQNFYVFTKNRIYQTYIQYPKELQSEKDSAEITLRSIQVEN